MNYRVYTDSEKSYEPMHLENEDSYLFTEFSFMQDKKIKLILLADGMGGLSDGAKASKNAVEGFISYFYQEVLKTYMNADMEEYSLRYAVEEIRKLMIAAMQAANTEVCRHADPYTYTGTTLTAICIIDDCAVIANVGDSPVYFYRKNKKQLHLASQLHTKAERDVMEGYYERYSEEYFNNDHMIYNSLGQYSSLQEEDIYINAIGCLRDGDVFLAGSDGCFGHLREEFLQNLIDDCRREEEVFLLPHLFSMARLDKNDDQTGVMYVVSEEDYIS